MQWKFFQLFLTLIFFNTVLNAQDTRGSWIENDLFNGREIAVENLPYTIDGKPVTYSVAKSIKRNEVLSAMVLSRLKPGGKKHEYEIYEIRITRIAIIKDTPQIIYQLDSAACYINQEDTVFTRLKESSAFNGGVPAWSRFLEKNLNSTVPSDNGAPPGIYTVTVQFIVAADGSISHLELLQDPGYGTSEEVMRVMRKGPLWAPAVYQGKPVKFLQRQRMTFMVTEE